MEIWKDIKDYEGYYQISSKGNVRSVDRHIERGNQTVFLNGQRIKPFESRSGYLQVPLRKNGKRESPYLHRLVAEHFIKNFKNLQEVNHINHNKKDCSVENLEWCSRQENMIAMAEFYGHRKKPTFCFCGNQTTKEGVDCFECQAVKKRTVDRPTPDVLAEELVEGNFSKVAKKYGVSDNAIRKWCKSYGMSTKAGDYKY